MRTLHIVMTAALVSVRWAAPAAACELSAADANEPRALLRKPLVGDEVRLASGFGLRFNPLLRQRHMHTGIDWAADHGTPVVSAGPGRVASVAVSSELGRTIAIDHGPGWRTLYGHLSEAVVASGDCVSRGTPIGRVGTTGLAAGPTLHFEVQREGRPIDPMSLSARDAGANPIGQRSSMSVRIAQSSSPALRSPSMNSCISSGVW